MAGGGGGANRDVLRHTDSERLWSRHVGYFISIVLSDSHINGADGDWEGGGLLMYPPNVFFSYFNSACPASLHKTL